MIKWDMLALIIEKKRVSMRKSIKTVSKELNFEISKYYRIEKALQEPNLVELQKILNYYGMELQIIIHK